MKKWSMLLMLAVAVLLMPVFSANVNAQDDASLSIDKTADKDSVSLGDTITYTFIVANSGNVTVDNITIEDDNLWTIPQDIGSLDPGDNVTITDNYTVVETDLPGPLENTAAVSGTDPDGNIISDNASHSIALTYDASIEVTKTPDKTVASPSETITYTYIVANAGNTTVDNVTLKDDRLGPISLTSTTLAPGDNVTATAVYTVASSDLPGPIVNTANVTGIDPTGEPVFAISNQVSVDLTYDASIEVIKTADRVSASPSETITYTYIINNAGNTTVDNVTLEDDRLGPISLTSTTLASGDNVTATAEYTVASSDLPGPIINTANVTGIDLTGEPVFASSDLVQVYLTYDASIEVTKTADKTVASSQDTITYTYIITNIGNAVVDNVTLKDDRLGLISLINTTLAPGDNVTATAEYTATDADLPGPIVNIATAEGQDPLGNTVTGSDSESVDLYPEEPGTRTLGFYKNHPCVIEQVLPIIIASENVTTAEQAISIMKDRSNHWSRLKSQLMVTILNVAVFNIENCTLEHLGLEGNETVNEIINQAEALLAVSDASKDDLSAMQDLLDSINNSNTIKPLPEDISEACLPGGGPPKTPPGKDKGFDDDPDMDDADAMTKAEILKLKGVPGKGIDKAPGLQKPFNPKSRVSERAGKKK